MSADPGPATVLRWGAATDTGRVRRNNQDNFIVSAELFAVADGMGGHAGGEVASRVAIETLEDAWTRVGAQPTGDDLVEAVREANARVFERSQADPALRGMGTTLTVAAVVFEDGEERIAVANVGDSRAYVYARGELTQLTEDHSVAEELVRQGQIGPDEVDTHPQRHILTRALGILPDVDVDLWEVLPYVGDRLVLCSDGLVRELTDDQIAAVLRRLADAADGATELVARARSAGGADNITVVVIDVVADGDQAHVASEAIGRDRAARPAGAAGSRTVTGVGAGGRPGSEPDVAPTAGTGAAKEASAPTPLPARRRRLTVRVVAFVVLVLAVLAAAGFALVAYARDSYFVTLGPAGSAAPSPLSHPTSRPLIIEKGRPGGLLWFHPTLVERTTALSDEVLPSHLADLQKGRVQPSLAAAHTYVANLVDEASRSLPTALTIPLPTTTTR